MKSKAKTLFISTVLAVACASQARGEAMLQLFNLTWNQISEKMPELAEAGYTALWLPPPSKANSQFSAGYDQFDPFDLGDKDQKGTIATRWGTKEDLIRMVRIAHRFGIRIYFDNIMNHRSYDVPGYDANTPITVYPGLLPEDFHLQVTADGSFRKWDNVGDWGNTWQIQHRNFSDLIDIAQEAGVNENFGATEGSTNPKLSFVRHPNNPELYQYHPTLGFVGFNSPLITMSVIASNQDFYKEDVGGYLIRAARWIVHESKCDGLRLDAVKHVPSYFFGNPGDPFVGYTGHIQQEFDVAHGYVPSNGYVEGDDPRNSCFDTEAVRNDAMIFGEHLGEPPSFSEYFASGMRLVDAPAYTTLNSVLGGCCSGLQGYDQRDSVGFAAPNRVMFAQSHDNGFSNRRELQLAFYHMREGLPSTYSDGWFQSSSCRECGGEFPRNAYANYLGEFGDNKMPDLAYQHNNLARGGTRPRWSDNDVVAWERYDYREPGGTSDQTVVVFAMNDNYGFPGDAKFVDGIGESCGGEAVCKGFALPVLFPPGSTLVQLADTPGKERTFNPVKVKLASNDSGFVSGDPANRARISFDPVPTGLTWGAIEILVPSGGYVMYAYQPPEPSRASAVLSNRVVTLRQGGVEVPHMIVRRTDGRDGDQGFNPFYPFKMRGSIDTSGNVIGGQNVSNLTYAIDIPVITNSMPIEIVLRTDASAQNILVRLDGGIDVNSHMGIGPSNTFTGGKLDLRDNKPGHVYDTFLGYEQPLFQLRTGPEKFAARDIARDTVVSAGAETYQYGAGGTNVVNGAGGGEPIDTQTANWVFHDPNASITVTNTHPATQRFPLVPGSSDAVELWVKVGHAGQINLCHIYYTTDGSNPEGSFGVGRGTTQVVQANFAASDSVDGSIDWWKGTIPANAGTVKYKIALHKTGIAPISDADSAKLYGQTQFAITNFNPITASVWLHTDLNTNSTLTGLEPGFHIIRARTFLPRDGKSSAYNTFLQTFYYDPAPPNGVIAFPMNNGETLGSHEYGVVVRADSLTTAVEYNIQDGNANNDDVVTGQHNGNGLSNGVPIYVTANQVSPYVVLTQQYPQFPLEYRFNYVAVPSNGMATIRARLKETTTATFTNRFTELVRTVNCGAPPQVLEIAFPSFNGENIFLDQNDTYTIVIRFTDTLSAVATNFDIRIDGSLQARTKPDGTPLYVFNDLTPSDGKNELRFAWGGMSAGPHTIEVKFNGNGLALQATRFVNVTLTGISVQIINPSEVDSKGRIPFQIDLPDVPNPTPAERAFSNIVVQTSTTVTNVIVSFQPVTNSFAGGPATFDPVASTNQLKFWNFYWTNLVQNTFVIRADALGGGSNTAFRTAKIVFTQIISNCSSNDDDCDDDGLSFTNETINVPLPNTQPENWVNGDVHFNVFTGKSEPNNPDTDNDGLPDALELGLGSSIAANTDTNADTNGDGFKNFIADVDPPKFNTTDNSGLPGFDLNKSRTDLIRGTMTNPSTSDTDGDGLMDSIEDVNRNGRVEITANSSTLQFPPTIRTTSTIDRNEVLVIDPNAKWQETDPNNFDTDGDSLPDGTEDADHSGKINGDTNNNFVWNAGELWTETDPRTNDTDGDGLSDGWETQYALNPYDDGVIGHTNMNTGAIIGNTTNGASGDPDGDSCNNLCEFNSGTDPHIPNDAPPPPVGSITIGQGPAIGTTGGITWREEFQDWTAADLKALDEYDGAGFLRRGRDVYPWYNDGLYDWSRDIVAFYARDGGAVANGGDGKYYFRIDFHDLIANAEIGHVDAYVVIDTGNPNVGQINLPDDVDAKTDMRWEAVVAAYDTNNGRVYVNSTTNVFNGGFVSSYYRGDLDAVEFAINRSALTTAQPAGAGWNGVTPLQFQVFTTRDGTQNSPLGAGDIGGRADITDTIFDDNIAESDTQAPEDTLKFWFSSINQNAVNLGSYQDSLIFTNRPNVAEVGFVLHGNQSILPGSIVQNLVSNSVQRTPTGSYAPLDPGNQPTGYYRALESADVFKLPLNLHLSGSLISALQWASATNKPSVDGPGFNLRIRNLAQSDKVGLLSGMFADHIPQYFTGAVNRAGIQLQDDILRSVYGTNSVSADSPLWLAEQAVDGPAMSDLAANSGHNFAVLTQMTHLWWWGEQLYGFGNGRTAALGDGGYQINKFNGLRTFLISGPGASDEMYNVYDFGTSIPLRELLIRKALSGGRDQIVVLADNWERAAGTESYPVNARTPDTLNLNLRWLANHPWIRLVRLDQFGTAQVDVNNDGTINGNDAPFVQDRNSGVSNPYPFTRQSKDFTRHNSETDYNNWYFGSGQEESYFNKFPVLHDTTLGTKKLGHVLTNNTVLADAWANVQASTGTLSNLARLVYLNGIFETAFHDDDNVNLARFSTGDYKFPDTTMDFLSQFALKPNARSTRQANIVAQASAWATSNPSLTPVATTQDVDHDGELEYILSNNRVYAVFEGGGTGKSQGGRLIAAFARDPASSGAYQIIGSLCSTPEFESEREGDVNVTGSGTNAVPVALRTSGFKDWFAQTNTPGVGTSMYVTNLYTAASAPSGTGWRFTSSDGKIIKTITLASGSNRLESAYVISGGVNKLFVRHGLAPDALNLLFAGQSSLQGPTNTGTKVSLTNSNALANVSVALGLSDAGHSNVIWQTSATDKDASFATFNMRNQAQTQQIELESTAAAFSFAIELSATQCDADPDADGLNNCQEAALGSNPSNPDTDGDGMNDGFENTYFGSPIAGDPNADNDGDGMNNLAESIAGTVPTNANSLLQIINVTRQTNGNVDIVWSSVVGKKYQVFSTTNLVATGFTPLGGTNTAVGVTSTNTDASAAGTNKLYKVKVLP